MRKMFLSLAALALVASPAFAGAGKYNSAVAPGDAAPAFSGIPAVMGEKDTSLSKPGPRRREIGRAHV